MLHLEPSDSDTLFSVRGTSQRAEVVKWFWKAATDGHSRDQHNLAAAYHNRLSVERDATEATRGYLMAVVQGVTASQIAIGRRERWGPSRPRNWVSEVMAARMG